MKRIEVTMVRIYLTEGEGVLRKLLKRLHDEEKVRGVTVFRGITGFGRSGRVHSAGLVDLGMDLPLVVEFFDLPERVERILHDLRDVIPPGHAVCWRASLNDGE